MSNNTAYRRNHYVPQWFQKRFLPPGQQKFFYLDMRPEAVARGNRLDVRRRDLLRWGPKRCFMQQDLYTTMFGSLPNTEIEQHFFGDIDSGGNKGVEYFSTFEHPDADGDAFNNIIRLMSIQKLRTPKGLEVLRQVVGADRNNTLIALQQLQNMYCATWSECNWQIVTAARSPTKFILSDHPVTVYNRRAPPGTSHCKGAFDPDIRLIGTHTIFPLDLERALILTNLSWLRNPFGDPLAVRPNPKLFRPTVFSFLEIQTGRELSEIEIQEINFIIKRRAHRYVSAAEKEWLYPERVLRNIGWYTLGGGDLFMPDPRSASFTTGIMVGYDNDIAEAYDPYGRMPGQPGYDDKVQSAKENQTFQAAQGVFAKKHGPRRRGRTYNMSGLDPEEDTPDMHQHHVSKARFAPKGRR